MPCHHDRGSGDSGAFLGCTTLACMVKAETTLQGLASDVVTMAQGHWRRSVPGSSDPLLGHRIGLGAAS